MTLRPLAGLRVVEVGHDMSAAFGARLLADLGAEVIKIEPLSGDPGRLEEPVVRNGTTDASAMFAYLNYGKRSVALDVASGDGSKLLADLLARSDLVIAASDTNVSPATTLVLDVLDASTRPVLVSVSPHGLVGPRSRQASSPFVLQHAAGFAFHQASPVSRPEAMPPVVCADVEGALAIGIVVASAALWALGAIEDGQPVPYVDLSEEDIYAYLLVEPFADWAAGMPTRNRQRDPAKPSMVAGGLVWLLPCADGAVMISPREDHQWERWLDVMGHPDWARDTALCGSRENRARNAPALGEKMSEWSLTMKAQDIFAQAQKQRVACFPVSSAKDMVDNAQLADRQFYSALAIAPGIVIDAPGLPFKMRSSAGAALERGGAVAAPRLGEGNSEVLSKVPVAQDDSLRLQAQGVA